MAIEKLSEFAKDGQKNTDDLVLTDGFSVSRKPARQWFNWLFNTLTLKINEIIEADYIRRNEIVDNLTTNDADKVASARTVKELEDNKLEATDLKDASTSQKGIVKLNDTLTSTSTTEALTAAQGKVLLEMFASSHTQNGYQKIANPLDPSKPLIIQWGKPGIINSGTTINFPIAFPNQVFIIIASDYDGSSVIGSTGWTLTNFKSRSNSAIAYNWFAVGF